MSPVSKNKNILRGVIVLIYVLMTFLILYGVAAIFTYLNTGADRSKILHTEIKKVDQYLPEVSWLPLNNEGRTMDVQTLNAIKNDYLDAWYIKHTTFNTNTAVGVEDYFTKSARQNIYNIIDVNTKAGTNIQGTTLKHHINLDFFSEDGQLAVLTDTDVIEYKRLFKNDTLIAQINEKSTYQHTLLLEDGFWRTRHTVKLKSQPNTTTQNTNPLPLNPIKGINYYPQASSWDMYNATFNAEIITKDFKIIKDAGLNSIRIFVPYEDFGKANVNLKKLERLTTVLDIAQQHNLKVLITLFDFYGDYSVLDWTLTHEHARRIVNALKNHDALLGWDIKNEPNLDFESRGKDLVMAWLDKMIDLIKSQDTKHPVTIGWSNIESTILLKDKLDFLSFHYYEATENFAQHYNTLKAKTGNKPIVVTEFGRSSYKGFWRPFGDSDEDQANYHKNIQTVFSDNNIQFMSWTLYDFTNVPKDVVGRLPWRKNPQKHFGFIDKNGKKKPAFKFISGVE